MILKDYAVNIPFDLGGIVVKREKWVEMETERTYPEGKKGEDIPELARIIAVADAYDAMTSNRSYRDPLPQAKVREEMDTPCAPGPRP